MNGAATIRETLLEMAATDGSVLALGVLEDRRCAIVVDGNIVEVHAGDDDASLGKALRTYFKLTEQHGGARHPFEAVETTWHPHAG